MHTAATPNSIEAKIHNIVSPMSREGENETAAIPASKDVAFNSKTTSPRNFQQEFQLKPTPHFP